MNTTTDTYWANIDPTNRPLARHRCCCGADVFRQAYVGARLFEGDTTVDQWPEWATADPYRLHLVCRASRLPIRTVRDGLGPIERTGHQCDTEATS